MSANSSTEAGGRFRSGVVVIVFGIIFLYMAATVFSSLNRKSISFFEAENGEITDRDSFSGIILRDEQLIKSPAGGYISFYVNNGEKAARNESVCLIKKASQPTGDHTSSETYTITDTDYSDIRDQMLNFRKTFTDSEFQQVKSLHFSLGNIVSQIVSREDIRTAGANTESGSIYNAVTCSRSGIISYTIDGMEGISRNDISEELFARARDEKTQLEAGSYVKTGQDVCRVIFGDKWEIIVRPDSRQIEKIESCLAQSESNSVTVKVYFPREDILADAQLELFESQGVEYASLSLDKYLVRFTGDRYTDIEIIWNRYAGFKVPASALAKRDYYMIPLSCIVSQDGSSQQGFIIEDPEGKSKFVKPGISWKSKDYCYVDADCMESGTVLKDSGSDKTFTVAQTGALDGIYTINQGYTRFCLVNILYTDGDYSIIENVSGSSNIKLYDRIVLDGDQVENEQIVY